MNDNYGVAEIDTLEDANAAWDLFFGRFFSPDIPEGVEVRFDPTLRQLVPRANAKAKYQPPGVLEGRTLHSDDFDDFLNGNTITIPRDMVLNAEGLEQVAHAIKQGAFKHNALKEESHIFYALWLFRQNRITRQQMTTLLARNQFPQQYPLIKTFPILNNQGEFSPEALKLLIPVIKSNHYGGSFTAWHLKRLKLLIQAAPKSEQIFFISACNPEIITGFNNEKRQLGDALKKNNAWYRTQYQKKTYDLHYSFGLIEALQISQRGIQGAASSRAILGKIGINTIKEGVEYYYRPTAISIPNSGVDTLTKEIHNYTNSPMPAVTAHDVFHSRLHDTISPEFHMMLNHFNQIIFKHTKQKWSKTMWELTDREFHAFQRTKIQLNSKNGAALLIRLLHSENKDWAMLFRHSTQDTLDLQSMQLSDDGFAIVWNMVTQSDVWKSLYKIDVDQLGLPYKPNIEKIKAFKQLVGTEHPSTQILTLKYYFYCATSKEDFSRICTLLDAMHSQLVEGKDKKLVFGKYEKGHDKNLTALKFKQGKESTVVYEDTVNQLLPVLVNMHLSTRFGEKNEEAVGTELQKIIPEFKSTYQNSLLTRELLDSSLSNLSTLTQKLDFLESSYESIIRSSRYNRRYALADSLFAFFKNPLTTSQRQHIILLQDRMNELLTEYPEDQKFNEQQSKEFQWLLKLRTSNLATCNTKRFYLNLDPTGSTVLAGKMK